MKRWTLAITWIIAPLMLAALATGCGSDSDSDTDPNPYQGTISGTWKGSGLNGTFTGTISADGIVVGRYDGDDSGFIAGVVDASGNFSATAEGAAGAATWTGSLQSNGTNVTGGSGTWQLTSFNSSGTWTSS